MYVVCKAVCVWFLKFLVHLPNVFLLCHILSLSIYGVVTTRKHGSRKKNTPRNTSWKFGLLIIILLKQEYCLSSLIIVAILNKFVNSLERCSLVSQRQIAAFTT